MNPFRIAVSAVLLCFAACNSPRNTATYAPGEKIGTYDPRAVCLAYGNGPRFAKWIDDLRARHAAAEKAGDTALAKQLEKQAIAQQERFHGQAFSGDDVDDILAVVADELPQLRADAGVVRLEKVNLARPSDVATVDVTARLVDLFEPSAQGRGWIAELKDRPLR